MDNNAEIVNAAVTLIIKADIFFRPCIIVDNLQ